MLVYQALGTQPFALCREVVLFRGGKGTRVYPLSEWETGTVCGASKSHPVQLDFIFLLAAVY